MHCHKGKQFWKKFIGGHKKWWKNCDKKGWKNMDQKKGWFKKHCMEKKKGWFKHKFQEKFDRSIQRALPEIA